MSSVAVVGAGHVGLVTAAALASLGNNVACLDVDEALLERLSSGDLQIVERGLPELVEAEVAAGRLGFHRPEERWLRGREFVFLCVPTPSAEDGRTDTSAVVGAARTIAPFLDPGAIVVNKSTVPVGSTLLVESQLGRTDLSVVSNPEFLREGNALEDTLKPQRIVIGSDDKRASARLAALYRSLDAPLLVTDPASAETIKYAANAFLAMKVSFANSLAQLCGRLGASLDDVLVGLGYDTRIGTAALAPGPGWGGSCLPKDTRALMRTAEDHGVDLALIAATVAVNEQQRARVIAAVRRAAGGCLAGQVVACWGLAFKAGTEDIRESPAVAIAEALRAEGATIQAYDPAVRECGSFEIAADPYTAARGATVIVVLTEWDEFRWLDFKKVAECTAGHVIVDTRRVLETAALRRAGFDRIGVEDL